MAATDDNHKYCQDDAVTIFLKEIQSNHEDSTVVITIKCLLHFIESDEATTLIEFRTNLKRISEQLCNCGHYAASISSACEQFIRFITLTSLEGDFTACKLTMIKRGNLFLQDALCSIENIARYGSMCIQDNSIILVYGKSRVVLQLLKFASKSRKISVLVTQSADRSGSGETMLAELQQAGISSRLICYSALGYFMETVSFVLLGAEGVVENGGIINKIGSYPLAVIANYAKKPVHVAVETMKFSRLFPLNQADLPAYFQTTGQTSDNAVSEDERIVSKKYAQNPLVDYTPPQLIKYLFTNIGILTPPAVSDNLIQLYV